MTRHEEPSRPPLRTKNPSGAKRRVQTAEQEERALAQRRAREAKSRAAVRNGLLSLGGLLLVGTIGTIWFLREADAEAAALAAVKARQDELRGELLAPGDLTPQKATDLLRRIDATRAEWQSGPDAEPITRRAEQARTLIAAAKTAAELERDTAGIAAKLAAGGLAIEQWRELHAQIRALQPRAEKGDAALRAQVAGLAQSVDVGLFAALVAAGSAAGASPEAAVAALTAAVDLAQEETAAHAKNRDLQHEWAQREHSAVGLYDAAELALPESALASSAFADLPLREDEWVTGRGGSLTRKVAADAVVVENAAGEKVKNGVVVLRHHDWHAGVFACDVELQRGKAILFPRVREKIAETGCGGLVLSTTPAEGAVVVPVGQSVHVELTVRGNKVVASVGTAPAQTVEMAITNDERNGGFGVVLHPDAVVTLRHLRLCSFDRGA